MRSFIPALATLFLSTSVPASVLLSSSTAEAAPPAAGHGPRKGKKPKKGRGNKNGKKNITDIVGAGQRLHFSFGGRLRFDVDHEKLTGSFTIVLHPLSPPGDIVNVVCKYGQLSNPEHAGSNFEFDAKGTCKRLHLDGRVTSVAADNHITLVDNAGGADAIDVDINGATGIQVPGGALSHGGFTISGAAPAVTAVP